MYHHRKKWLGNCKFLYHLYSKIINSSCLIFEKLIFLIQFLKNKYICTGAINHTHCVKNFLLVNLTSIFCQIVYLSSQNQMIRCPCTYSLHKITAFQICISFTLVFNTQFLKVKMKFLKVRFFNLKNFTLNKYIMLFNIMDTGCQLINTIRLK